jgi:hypothetical protein
MFTDAIGEKTIDITGHDEFTRIHAVLTEDGTITGTVTETREGRDGMGIILEHKMNDTTGQTHDMTGTDQATGSRIEISDGYITTNIPDEHETGDDEIGFRAGTITSTTAPDETVILDSRVTIQFDVLNFDPPTAYVPLSNDAPLLEREDFEIHAGELPDTDERLDELKEWRRPLRTGTLTITQQVNGPPDRQVSHATCTVEPVMWLLGFLQGVMPAPVKATITAVDGTEPDWEFEQWIGSWKPDIGSAFASRNIGRANDAYVWLDHAYDRFVRREDEYKYKRCLSWYFDALLQNRTVEAKTASIAAGIESLARRYAAYDDDVGSETEDVIANLAGELNVPVDDLAAFSTGFEESSEWSNAYFYVGSRNAAVHNDRVNVSFDDAFRDYEAALTMFRRVTFHEFTLPGERERYTELNNLDPRDNRLD